MQFRRSNDTRAVDADWHLSRQRARESAFNSSLSIFSDAEIVKYDLETARITGADNPRTFMWNRALDVFGTNGTDIRELRNR